jgi:outer membrane receptor protein involved in Fe transport
MHTKKDTTLQRYSIALLSAIVASGTAWAQTPSTATTATNPDEEDVIILSPFEVSASDETGYAAATTLAGNRLNTELRDIGNAVTVITGQFLKDIGATNNETLLQYTTGTEVGNVFGNFAGTGDGSFLDESNKFARPNQNTRVRGLTEADNTRDYFLTDIPWDGYAVDGVDLQRGPNSILFGQGSPAGIINTRTKQASFKDANQVEVRYGSFGSKRASVDFNRVLIKGELAMRIAAVYADEKFKQDPAYDLSKRLYGATRWEPGFLKKGSARTIFRANYEVGDISTNRPRTLPPIDLITPWFKTGTYQGKNIRNEPTTYNYLNRETFIPAQLQDDNTGLPNHGQMRPSHNGGPNAGNPNPYYNPWVGNFAQQFGNPMIFFDHDKEQAASPYWTWEPRGNHGIGPDGAIDRGLALPFQRPGGIATQAAYARNARLPYAEFGIYKDNSLTDPTIFDFYNNLLDGPNKKEWQKFRTYNVNLAQTFFDDKMGFEVTYNREYYKSGQLSLLAGERQAIYIDINKVYSDGTPAGLNGETAADGTPNPNVGRPFVADSAQFGNNQRVSNRESGRATVFFTHDFTKNNERSWWTRALGEHRLTGLYNQDAQSVDQRSWQRYGTDDSYEQFLRNIGTTTPTRFNDNALTPHPVIYLGPSLINSPTASGAYIPRPTEVHTVKSGTMRLFDSTWNRSTNPADPNYVNPAAFWRNDYYPAGNTSGDSTQSENPANYVGWVNRPLTVIDSETSQANRDMLTTGARLTKNRVFSRAFVWQAHLWDNALVGTWGVRKDVSKSWGLDRNTTSASSTPTGRIDLGSSYALPSTRINTLEITSHAWTVVAHLNEFPGLSGLAEKLPINVSLFYNTSTNFQPASQRVDLYGDPLAPPSGETTDQGILLESKDNRFSLKINKFETTSTNASSNALGGAWFIGASQAWSGNWVNRFEFNWRGDTINDVAAPNDPDFSLYNYAQAPGESVEQAAAREQSVISAWRAWQKSVDPRFYTAWGLNLNDPTKSLTANVPQGFTVTEDSLSKGYEIEFNALPLKNWRLTLNASKTTAIRENIGGTALSAFIESYQTVLNRGVPGSAGDLRIWWGGAGNETAIQQWNSNIGSEYAQRKLQEGTNVPELREWRLNAITNYDFESGALKGVYVGGGVRYQSDIVIGYRPIDGALPGTISFDIANPYMGPAETNYDAWIGYGRRVARNIDWSIQLNVRNIGVGNELIPITTQPDGTPAGYRIAPYQTWTITNTFKF